MIGLRATLLISAVALAAASFGGSAVVAEERTCRGQIGATTVDNLRVPDGATCWLRGTRVKGTIKVESRATLRADNVIVIGNVQGENARRVVVQNGSRVGGSVQVVQGGGAKVANSRVNGDIYYDENSAPVRAIRNRVGGNIQAFQNNGGVEIRGNAVDGNLQCKANRPRPYGGNNIVGGNKEDQCERL